MGHETLGFGHEALCVDHAARGVVQEFLGVDF